MYRMAIALTALIAVGGCASQKAQPAMSETAGFVCSAAKMDDKELVGKTEKEAEALLNGCPWRIAQRDGQSLPGTMDYRPDRRNLGIANGKVIWVRRG
ncbi:hypothetical protein [Crenobacter cavernae]|uniref:Lipoprotein n=1 Tax=Crenobacter cavernae TaxID=2290923 RepID=A0ABY0FJ93_9NEIS|nr:hypothetical protein [Crenobacter cavernae]RXZ45304.1 hypothetical protein EBB06_00310 [Crenobacter cavernae]